MQNSTQKATFERGFFRRAFQEFDEQTFFSNLQNRLQEQPYYRKNRGLKDVLLSLSYALNAISALSASYLIYWLTETLTGFTIVAYAVAGVFLFFLEKLKRKSSNEFFQVYFFDKKRIAVGWLILSLFCFGLSVSSTYFGTEQGAKDVAPKASTLLADATEKEIKQEIEKLETENDKYEGQTTKDGTIYFPLQRSIEQNKIMISSLRNRLIKKQEEREENDKNQKGEYLHKINLTATTLAWILVFLELIFECCIAYVWYYYYRSFIEWKKIKEHQQQNSFYLEEQIFPQNFPPPPPPTQTSDNRSNIKNEISQKPILGFLRQADREMTRNAIKNEKTSVNDCTGVYRQDLYTISHVYQKGSDFITVHYTEPQVRARLNQWIRAVEEAEKKNLSKQILDNRQGWVKYWESRLSEIRQKNIT